MKIVDLLRKHGGKTGAELKGKMKHLLITTIAAVVLVGCGESQVPSVKKSNQKQIAC
jgi:hypothetical protein